MSFAINSTLFSNSASSIGRKQKRDLFYLPHHCLSDRLGGLWVRDLLVRESFRRLLSASLSLLWITCPGLVETCPSLVFFHYLQ